MVFVIWSTDTNQCHSLHQTIPGDTGRQTSHSHWYMCRVHRIPGLGIRWRLMKNKVWSRTIHIIAILYRHIQTMYHHASNIVYNYFNFNWYSRWFNFYLISFVSRLMVNTIPVSHFWPVNPVGHAQKNVPGRSKQVPPFKHVSDRHTRNSVLKIWFYMN